MDVTFDIRALRVFVAVAEVGAVSKATDSLARTQAAISMQLQKIERDLGVKLFERSPRGVALTSDGEDFLGYARRILALTEDMQRGLTDKRLSGRLRLGIFEDLAVTRLPLILAQFRQNHPLAELELISSYSSDLARHLNDGRCDLVIADPSSFATPPRSHISHQLVWSASRLMEVDEAKPLPLVLFDTTCSWQDRMISSLAEHNISWCVGCRVKTLPAMIAALRAGLGMGILFPETLTSDCQTVGHRFGLPEAPRADFGVFLGATPTLLAEEFARFLKNEFEAVRSF
ncbi:LysR family transcriptional regulator [Agrobacterium larrymoorei]|uniref:LysR family transcriptional regulator n=1 Tax=Agrobacterium larrymoorei TaxID=160699 RepID=UPI0015735E62|nr:LysR substrate-binding domain-containing protein [Agrobacterium larrymoorei]NTJ44688.1 LysR family transcriptional regulator [Agrobacterium larrymoorei]